MESEEFSKGIGTNEELLSVITGINLRPNKLEFSTRSREFKSDNKWIYKIDQYFSLMKLENSGSIVDQNKIVFASKLMNDPAQFGGITQ